MSCAVSYLVHLFNVLNLYTVCTRSEFTLCPICISFERVCNINEEEEEEEEEDRRERKKERKRERETVREV